MHGGSHRHPPAPHGCCCRAPPPLLQPAAAALQWLLALLQVLPAPSADAAGTSKLWGRNGEKWSPRGRLNDFSFAGEPASGAPARTVLPFVGAALPPQKMAAAQLMSPPASSLATLQAITRATTRCRSLMSLVQCWTSKPAGATTPPCSWRRWSGPTSSRQAQVGHRSQLLKPRGEAVGREWWQRRQWWQRRFGTTGAWAAHADTSPLTPLGPAPPHPPAGMIVLSIPAGTVELKKRLDITRSSVVLRGAGRGKTTLNIPKSALGSQPAHGAWQAGSSCSICPPTRPPPPPSPAGLADIYGEHPSGGYIFFGERCCCLRLLAGAAQPGAAAALPACSPSVFAGGGCPGVDAAHGALHCPHRRPPPCLHQAPLSRFWARRAGASAWRR